ncbi:MAG: membrane protein insertase YidC [Gammaproteobacteria bacterium]
MDNIRFVLFVVFSMLLVMLWEAWQQDYGPKRELPVSEQKVTADTGEDLPVASVEEAGKAKPLEPEAAAVPVLEDAAGKTISVKTDVFSLEIDTKGGTLQNLDLLDYPVTQENPDESIRLLSSDEEKLFLAQSGLIAGNGSAPNHHTLFSSQQDRYEMGADQNTLRVPLVWTDGQGLQVTKTFVFTRGSYVIGLEQKISNRSEKDWSGRQYAQLMRKPFTEENSNTFIRTYTGGVLYTEEEKYEKIEFEDMADNNLSVKTTGGWSAMIQHYFASAWIPPENEENHFYTKKIKDARFVIGAYSPLTTVSPGGEAVLSSKLFSGPKIQPMMEKIAPGLELTVDYGILTFIGKPIFWLLNNIHKLVENWGLAIMGVTLCIKALFFKLSETSYRSMAKMRKIQPRLQQLKERYGEDRQRFNHEMMAMYKKEKVNPMGGCFPILVQIPVFISLYWVLIETVELRQAPFAFWITDLSVMDPYFVLPLLMGVSMWVQQKLNPAPIDPIQARVIKMFPVLFTVFFLFFPAGLVLYWVVNNTLSIVQQWYITKKIEEGGE